MSIPDDVDYLIRSYAPAHKGGHLLLVTWHRGEASKDLEIQVLEQRRRRGEIGIIQLIDYNNHTSECVYV